MFVYVAPLLKKKPLTTKYLENTLLKLNDLYGYTFKGIVTGMEDHKDGAIKLTVTVTPVVSKTKIIFDNYASKFTGPHELSISHNLNLTPFHQLLVTGSINPFNLRQLNQIHLTKEAKIHPKLNLDISANFNRTIPDQIISNVKTNSRSNNLSISLMYQLIRQRNENLNFKFSFNLRNSSNYINEILSSRDYIRSVKLNTNYDFYSGSNNYHSIGVALTKGLKILGATQKSSNLKSREKATPNFHKLELTYAYWRALNTAFSLLFNLYGQFSDQPLYTSEEFGYGGQTVGRSFDNSEITGDHGLAAMLEINYNNLKEFKHGRIFPYIYYDFGIVWRKDPNRKHNENGASIGLGIRSNIYKYINANLGLAWPLLRKIQNPIYGRSNTDPRISFKISTEW